MAFLALLAAPSFVLSSYVVVLYFFFFFTVLLMFGKVSFAICTSFIVLTLFQLYLSLLAEIELLPIY